jgi:nitrogen-specific signal transduction histidine kinase
MKASSPTSGTGLGQKLVETFAKHLDAKVEIQSSSTGTTHKILVPALA